VTSWDMVHYPDPRLRRRSVEITPEEITDELREKIDGMWPVMYEEGGIGLAAAQVGWNVRLFCMNLAGEPGEGEEVVILNPVIKSKQGIEVGEEGCLSLPGIHGDVARARQLVLAGVDLDGEPIEVACEGLAARCVQHELDHLDGKLIIDYFSPADKKKSARRIEELERTYQARKEEGSAPSKDAVAT